MGMFDSELGKPFAESGIREGQPFRLEDAKIGPTVTTKFGPKPVALLTIGGVKYSVFGAGIVSQVNAIEPGDLPAEVVIRKRDTGKGNPMPLLFPVSAVPDDVMPVGESYTGTAADDDIPF